MAGEVDREAEAGAGVQERKVEPGSFVEGDLVIRVKDTNELVDTTLEEEARKAGVTTGVFKPRLAIVGRGYLLKPIEDELINMRVSEQKTVELPPERAFGERDPSKVRIIPLRRFKDVEQPLSVGMRVIVDGKEGYIRSIESGRVQVDFNHRLAGKTLVSQFWVRKILVEDKDKILGVIGSLIPEATAENTQVDLRKPEVIIKLAKETYTASGIQLLKQTISREIFQHIDGVSRVIFVEEYLKEEK
ncbi:MAG: FKBP-type peptidyl-prolyl cis-trans isomerase [Nitrososphaerota archaeon]